LRVLLFKFLRSRLGRKAIRAVVRAVVNSRLVARAD
jgi:hypothetical protein